MTLPQLNHTEFRRFARAALMSHLGDHDGASEICEEAINNTSSESERNIMHALFMSNLMAAAGITATISACMLAIKIAIRTGRAVTPQDAADQQETWCDAFVIQQGIDNEDEEYW